MEELNAGLMISKNINVKMKDQIKSIIIKYWDFFCTKGVCVPFWTTNFPLTIENLHQPAAENLYMGLTKSQSLWTR